MGGKLTRAAYEQLVAENLAWLDAQPRTLEREHIRLIVESSAEREYGSDAAALRDAIRAHRDERGHNRCWLDDRKLYAVLGEGEGDGALPPRAEFLSNCERYYEVRRSRGEWTPTSERDFAIARAERVGRWLGNLLAIIHRDGGQHQATVGDEQAVKDAHERWGRLVGLADRAETAERNLATLVNNLDRASTVLSDTGDEPAERTLARVLAAVSGADHEGSGKYIGKLIERAEAAEAEAERVKQAEVAFAALYDSVRKALTTKVEASTCLVDRGALMQLYDVFAAAPGKLVARERKSP